MRSPPTSPTQKNGLPSFSTTMGAMLLVTRLPGAMELAMPGCGSKMFMVLFSSIPVPGTVAFEPNGEWIVCVAAITLPSASAAAMCVVAPDSAT